jgi:hypothetical protein
MNRESRSEAATFTKIQRPASEPAAWCLWGLESGAILVLLTFFKEAPMALTIPARVIGYAVSNSSARKKQIGLSGIIND